MRKLTLQAMLLLGALFCLGSPSHVQAAQRVPYVDRVAARITAAELDPVTGLIGLPFEGNGFATGLGVFSTAGELFVDPDSLLFTGVNTITTAGGEEIFVEIVGLLTPTARPGLFDIRIATRFVGGTGRFEGATGGFRGFGRVVSGPGGALAGATFRGFGVGVLAALGAGGRG